MAYREKLAALNFVVMALVYSVYFTIIATHPPAPRLLDMLWLFGIAAPTHAILYGLIGFAIKVQAGKEGSAPPDERDREIARHSRTIAYFVLLAGTILTGVIMPFSDTPWQIVNTTLLVIVIAELICNGVIVLSYRRGWHG